ncbi:MAG: sigma 54-interacting transcriptional regulator [Candidatus Marinimicrobia bacterium]|nr:sigma 54-interacting transcriptional regulator [Candidatus Neomarinimicrobiota bacterium]
MKKWGNLIFIGVAILNFAFSKEQPLHLIPLDFNRAIHCIYQDSNYYLWFGTDDGLYRYNGKDYVAYKIDPYQKNSISDDNITALYENGSRDLLIGTKFGGINKFNSSTENFLSFQNDLMSRVSIHAICNFQNEILFGIDSGLFRLKSENSELSYQAVLTGYTITDILSVDDHCLMVATENNGFFHYDNFEKEGSEKDHFLSNVGVNFLLKVNKNIILISTRQGLYYYNLSAKSLKSIEHKGIVNLSSVDKNAITMDHLGNIWIGLGYELHLISTSDDFNSIDIQSFELDVDNQFSKGINALYFDHSGVLWINLKGKGLYKYFPLQKFLHFNIEEGLMSNMIFSVIENNSHSILLGTHHGLFVYDLEDHLVERIPGTEELNFQVITALYKDSYQNLWCGTNNGLYKFGSSGDLVHYKHSSKELSSISSDFVSSIVGDPLNVGDLWIGTSDGLNRYRKEYDNFIHYFHDQKDEHSIAGNNISHLYFSQKKDLWIGTENEGLSRLNWAEMNKFDPKFVNYGDDITQKESISDTKITYISESNDRIWIGTENGGLNSIDTLNNFNHYLETKGLLDNHILSILSTQDDFLWIATRDGISKFDTRNRVFKNYYFKDGIKKGEFINKSACITKNGKIILGSKAGFTFFHPSQIVSNINPAVPQVAGVYLFNQKIKNEDFKGQGEIIKLKYNQNVISFEICALHYVSPLENIIDYYLEGVDESWGRCRNFEYLTYSNLKPGQYTFHIKVANNDNIWNENEKSLKITITAPFWRTFWFQFIVISLIAGLAFLFIKQRLNEIEKKKFHLEKQIGDKIKINEELNKALAEVEQLKIKLENENTYLKKEIEVSGNSNYKEIVTNSKKMNHILAQVDIASGADPTILILGESGTGKDLLAHAIHKSSNRSKEPFIKVDCAALPPNLIESELFGHEKGAFTSANMRKIGRFELANGGTIFLDEIGELPIKVQQKLLRVLQSGEFERLGNSVTLRTNTRIIAATNRNLEDEVKKGQFREDLYYRLNVFPINIPPLRERMEDVPLLVQHFIDKYAGKFNKTITKIPQKTITALMSYSWPGNIRELENIVQRAIIISRDDILELGDWFKSNQPNRENDDENIFISLEEIQKRHIERILEFTNGKVSGENGAAEILKINPKTLFSRMKKLNINN